MVAVPGIALSVAIATIAVEFNRVIAMSGASPLILAIALGLLWGTLVGVPDSVKPGLKIASRLGFKTGVVLLGFQMTFGQSNSIGWRGAWIATVALLATYLCTYFLGRLAKIDPAMIALIAAGTSVCGASAIVGANTIARADDEDVSYAVATVTMLGLVSMLTYPWISSMLSMNPSDYGIWVGSSIHEVAQVVAAGYQAGPDAGQMATVVKLVRVTLLAPGFIVLWLISVRQPSNNKARIRIAPPWFALGFLAAAVSTSLQMIPNVASQILVASVPWMLTIGSAAVGIETNLRILTSRGFGPLLVASAATLFIATFSLVLIAVSA